MYTIQYVILKIRNNIIATTNEILSIPRMLMKGFVIQMEEFSSSFVPEFFIEAFFLLLYF